jgi:hypothetical protein
MSATSGRVNIQGGGLVMPISGRSADVTLTGQDYTVIVDATVAPRIVNLPPVADSPGRIYIIKKADGTANAVTVTANGANTIEGFGILALTAANPLVAIQSDGNSIWHIIGRI